MGAPDSPAERVFLVWGSCKRSGVREAKENKETGSSFPCVHLETLALEACLGVGGIGHSLP